MRAFITLYLKDVNMLIVHYFIFGGNKMALIYVLIGFLIALFLPNKVDDIAKRLVIYAYKKIAFLLKRQVKE